MAYRFEANETVADAVRRIAGEELRSAAYRLSRRKNGNRDEAIHEARKSIKKTRALLKLMRLELGDCFDRDNLRLREIGQQLSEIRDAAAMPEIFEPMAKDHAGELPQKVFVAVGAELHRRKKSEASPARMRAVLPRMAAALRVIAKDAGAWPLQRDGFEALEPGLRQTLKRGRHAMMIARDNPEPHNFHQWRKRTKEHYYHTKLLEGMWSDAIRKRDGELKELETVLGDEHNLSVLCEKIIADQTRFGSDVEVDSFLELAMRDQEKLRTRAIAMGTKLHEEKARGLTAKLSRLWNSPRKVTKAA
jgi:CHAD domain-containing protein